MTATFTPLMGLSGGPRSAADVVRDLPFTEWAPPGRPYVVVNMVATLDGRATIGGRAGPIGNEADRELFHALRACGDAVMAGAGTVRAEHYGRLVRDETLQSLREELGSRPTPLAVVPSHSLAFPDDLPLLNQDAFDVLMVTDSEQRLEPEPQAAVGYLRAPLNEALAALRARHGVRAVVCEGGPMLNAELFPAGLADELFLCISPILTGGAGPTTLLTGALLDPPVELELVWLLVSGGYLFGRWRVSP